MLLLEFLDPLKLTQREVADAIGVPYQRVNELVNGRRGITPSTALRLARFLGTTPELWLELQIRWDVFHAARSEATVLGRIRRFRKPGNAA
jgi:addiction module HigA family antidote